MEVEYQRNPYTQQIRREKNEEMYRMRRVRNSNHEEGYTLTKEMDVEIEGETQVDSIH